MSPEAGSERTAADASAPVGPGEGRRIVRRAGRWGFKVMGHSTLLLPVVLRITPEGLSRRLTASTDVVVEGLPRSGNTFAAFALDVASGGTLRIASRVHVPAQVTLAVRRGLPTMVTVREPVEASISHMAAVPHLSATRALREYVDYYERILDLRDGVVLADFDEITTDFGPIVTRMNERFGTDLPPFHHTETAVAEVFAAVDAHWDRVHAGRGRDAWLPRPADDKPQRKARLREEFGSPGLRGLVDESTDLYRRLSVPTEGAR